MGLPFTGQYSVHVPEGAPQNKALHVLQAIPQNMHSVTSVKKQNIKPWRAPDDTAVQVVKLKSCDGEEDEVGQFFLHLKNHTQLICCFLGPLVH